MGKYKLIEKAIFLDRDGVINKLIYNDRNLEYEPPHKTADVIIINGVYESLKKLQCDGFGLFLISNQPDYAKGKTSLESLRQVHSGIHEVFVREKINFEEYYYCYHHPQGIVKEFAFDCKCRKPKPYFINKAIEDYGVKPENSWMIGDRDSDIECGLEAGLKTILIKSEQSKKNKPDVNATFMCDTLLEAVNIIVKPN